MQACITAFMISISLLAKTSFSDVPLRPGRTPLLANAEDALRLADLSLIHSWYSKTCVQLRCCSLLLVLTTFAEDRWSVHRFDALLSLSALNMQRLHILYNYKSKNNIPRRYVPSLKPSQCCVPRNWGMCKRNCKKNSNSTSKQKNHVYHPAPVEKWANIRIFRRRSMSEFKAQDLVATLTETRRVQSETSSKSRPR